MSEWLLFVAVSPHILESVAHHSDSERARPCQHLPGREPPPATGEEGFSDLVGQEDQLPRP